MEEIHKLITEILKGPVFDKLDQSIVVSNAAIGVFLIGFALVSRLKVPVTNLSEMEYVATIAFGALLMAISAIVRLHAKKVRAERLAAVLKAENSQNGKE